MDNKVVDREGKEVGLPARDRSLVESNMAEANSRFD